MTIPTSRLEHCVRLLLACKQYNREVDLVLELRTKALLATILICVPTYLHTLADPADLHRSCIVYPLGAQQHHAAARRKGSHVVISGFFLKSTCHFPLCCSPDISGYSSVFSLAIPSIAFNSIIHHGFIPFSKSLSSASHGREAD
jgi:hypothetical protein